VYKNQINETEKKKQNIIDYKIKYINTYHQTNENYKRFLALSKEILNKLDDCGIPLMKSLLEHIHEDETSPVKSTIIDQYTICYTEYDGLLSNQFVKFDNSPEGIYKHRISRYLNNSNFDCIKGDYIKGLNATKELKNTIQDFIDYQSAKIKTYDTYTQQLASIDASIRGSDKLIKDLKDNLKKYEEMRRDLTKLITGTGKGIKEADLTIRISKNDCDAQNCILNNKISRSIADQESFEKLKVYFQNNYSKITQELKQKYHPADQQNINLVLKTKMENSLTQVNRKYQDGGMRNNVLSKKSK